MNNQIAAGLVAKMHTPVGTVEKLEKCGLDPAIVPSCARPGSGIRGCKHFTYCEMPYKGKDGPQYHGVLTVTVEGSAGTEQRACWEYMQNLAEYRSTGEVFEIVADAGEKIFCKESRPKPVPGSGGRTLHEDVLVEREIGKFPDPPDNPELAAYFRAVKAVGASAQLQQARRREAITIPAITPESMGVRRADDSPEKPEKPEKRKPSGVS